MFCAIFTLTNVIVVCFIVHNAAIEPDEDVSLFEDDNSISIGGLFEDMESQRRLAFEHAVEMINSNPSLALQSRLVAKSKEVPHLDSFIVGKRVCELMSEGVAGIFGPMSPVTTHHVQSLCDTMEIPHISTKWDLNQRRSSCLLNLHPHPDVLSKAMRDIVEAWNFKGFTVLYDDFDALRKINSLIKMADDKGYLVTVRQLELNKFGNYRTVLGGVKHSEEKNIVIECSNHILFDVLMQAHQVGLVGSEYNYIITSLDFQTIDMEPFQWAGTNITGIRLVRTDDPYVIDVITNWTSSQDQEENNDDKTIYHDYYDMNVKGRNEEHMENDNESGAPTTVEQPKNASDLPIPITEAALTHDAVLLLSKALRHLDITRAKSMDCHAHTSWAFGFTVINFMRLTEVKGMSGLVKFDHEGFRRDIELEIVELGEEGLKKRGSWNSTTGLSMIYQEQGEEQSLDADDLRNTTFTVLIALTHPYAMLKEAANTLIGNDRYEGFGIDVIHELSLMSGFNYTFKEHYDKSSGNPETSPNGTRIWTGMIGEVLAGRADLAIADITITREREMDADFTMPIMNLGVSILHRTPGKAPPSLFSFLSPFSYQVWGCVMSAYFGVSLLLFIMARISPYEWTNPYPCIEEPENLENQFSFINSLWFTIGSLMQQGSDIAPIAIFVQFTFHNIYKISNFRSVSTRMVASIWWFFTLIMVSSYTANLAAFLTVEDVVKPFEDVKELANQDIIKWGAKHGGSTVNFFRDSKDPTYKKIYEFMKNNPDCMMTSNEDGVDRVLRERNYAFFMESTSIEYEVERKCNLGQVGGLLDNKGYGIVMRQNSTYWDILSRNVVKLQEKGRLIHLKDKWWKEKRGGGACLDKKGTGEASELNLDNVGGMFVVLVSGCIIAAFLSIMELLFDIYTREDKASFKEELMHEIKFIMKCRGTVKPMRQPTQVFADCNDIDKKSKYSSKTSLYI